MVYVKSGFTNQQKMVLGNIVFHMEHYNLEIIDVFYGRLEKLEMNFVDKHFKTILEPFRQKSSLTREKLNNLANTQDPAVIQVLKSLRSKENWKNATTIVKDLPIVSGLNPLKPVGSSIRKGSIRKSITPPPSPTGPIQSPKIPEGYIPKGSNKRNIKRRRFQLPSDHVFHNNQWAVVNIDELHRILGNIQQGILQNNPEAVRNEASVFCNLTNALADRLKNGNR